jgi:methionine aminopeptidase
MILAPLAAATVVVATATGPTVEPRHSPNLSTEQKSAAMQPLMRSATECIARAVSANPHFGQRNSDLGDLIVASISGCSAQVRAMIEAYDRYFGDGEGEAFFMGPYLDVLPAAVSTWVKDADK